MPPSKCTKFYRFHALFGDFPEFFHFHAVFGDFPKFFCFFAVFGYLPKGKACPKPGTFFSHGNQIFPDVFLSNALFGARPRRTSLCLYSDIFLWGVAFRCGVYGAVCFHLERRLMVFSTGGNTHPQPACAASGRVFLCLVVTVPPFFRTRSSP